MQLSTVKRESLIPPVYLVSIALLLIVSFIILLPSRETFVYTPAATTNADSAAIDELDLAYLKARDAAGDLSVAEMRNVIHTMIRGKKWQQARALLEQRPEIVLTPADQFLLRLETATAGYFDADNEARNVAYEASLISMMTQLLDTPTLHDVDTLTRASQISTELRQPELSAAYHMLLANADQPNAVHWLEQCARILSSYQMHGQSVQCYKRAIAKSTDADKTFQLTFLLTNLYTATGDSFAANAELEKMARMTPLHPRQMERLADLALATERPDLAYPLYARLSLLDEPNAVMWLEQAARWAEASSLPGLAAEYVLNMANLSGDANQEPLAKRRQRLLLASGRNEDALQTVYERITKQPDNADLLIEGIEIASNMGLTTQALDWNEDLLALRPYELTAMKRQINFALRNRELDSALIWAQRIVEVDPSNEDSRVKLAQLEEWNGNIQNAQSQREWLAENFISAHNDRELIRLAQLNWDSATAAETLRRLSRREPLSTENILKLVKLYEQDGRPDTAAEALEEMMTNRRLQPMLLRELAALHKRHRNFDKSLQTWEKFTAQFGRSSEESLNRMELLWRLKQRMAAVDIADDLGKHNLTNATETQLKVISEIGWRYRKPALVLAAAPFIDQLDLDDETRLTYTRQTVQSLTDKTDYKAAVELSEKTWHDTNQLEFLLTAMHIALDHNVYPHLERFLDATDELLMLREIPEYWLTVAEFHTRNRDTVAALETYRNILATQPDSSFAITGLLWTLLGSDDSDDTNSQLQAALDQYEDLAVETPDFWSQYAMSYLKLGKPEISLRWFSKLMVKDDHDYNILLSFADALEQTGNSVHAFKVRSYALGMLRPMIVASTIQNTNALARDYISLLQIYGSASENEAWTNRLLEGIPGDTDAETAWRSELAASWYLATQRSDYARLLMTRSHEKRIQAPAWQTLALALAENNVGAVKEILASGKALSNGDRILALRKIGDDRKAYELASANMVNERSNAARSAAQAHVISLRPYYPGYYAGRVQRREIDQLDITETGLSLRHTLSESDLGFAVDYRHSTLASDIYRVDQTEEDDIAVSAYFGGRVTGGSITAGVNNQGENVLTYATGSYHTGDLDGRHVLRTKVGLGEVTDSGAELRLGAKQDRAEFSLESAIGKREFIKLSGNYNEISTRNDGTPMSQGVGASLELGTRGSFGSNNWSMGVVASGEKNKLEDTLPDSIRSLSSRSTFSRILAKEKQELAVSASLFRGGIHSDYLHAASPRYHLTATVGHNLQADSTAFQVHAGAGFRVLGNDELSLQLSHDRSVSAVEDAIESVPSSTIGIQYRNHF